MESREEILNSVRSFCDPTTGELLQRLPEELMQQLRVAKLARGIPLRPSNNTQTQATWFVFLNDQIRDDVLRRIREIRQSKRKKDSTQDGAALSPPKPVEKTKPTDKSRPPATAKRGLGQFRKQRKPE